MSTNKKKYQLTLKEYRGLFDTLYTSLCLLSNKYLNNLEASKDIVQDVFIKVWEKKIVFEHKNNVKAYLYTAVKNQSLDYLKSKRYTSTDNYTIKDIEKLETETYFLREVVIEETSLIIENAVNTLPNKCAQIIRLSLKKHTNIDIANELEISINTVKAQKRIAYQKLRLVLKDHFILILSIFDQ